MFTLVRQSKIGEVVCGSLSSGPDYTYSSGGHFTTVDYVLTNQDGARGVCSCSVLEEHPPNTSDHLPIITCSLDTTFLRSEPTPAFPHTYPDWSKAAKTESLLQYTRATDEAVEPLMEKDYALPLVR